MAYDFETRLIAQVDFPSPSRVASEVIALARDPNIDALERELAERFATKVEVAHGRGGRGKLVIHYHSNDELDGILGKLR